MFDIAPTELLLVAVVALVVIGPKDLPRAMRFVGQWVGRARGVARHFRSGLDEMIRQAELEEMEKKWAAENARIMQEHPQAGHDERGDDLADAAMTPLPAPADSQPAGPDSTEPPSDCRPEARA
ncbi:twin-arginine translocase subunit TatB [Sphingomonas oleivorans]|uniref:Sec-independent protein translocase protein TatB n=1 Tax=Sphingomonas oleivorans TaxID=1735121 RepID=A0A2T5FY79_9SPHN|nr:Sec-independent protein translocase protein TatB [Sphingomonas oleivorans]PTQ11489.1 twin-arginine translocase subunit TatB [Sphingomonas oleivorans]